MRSSSLGVCKLTYTVSGYSNRGGSAVWGNEGSVNNYAWVKFIGKWKL